MNKISSMTDCLNTIDMSIVQTTYFISIEKLEKYTTF